MKNILPLVIFCAALFSNQAWAAVGRAEGYKINPSDGLRIEVLEDPSFNRDVFVGPDGRITLPLAGTFPVYGQTLEGVTATIREQLKEDFALEPTVIVSLISVSELGQLESTVDGGPTRIYVLGEVGTPGQLILKNGTTLLQAFSMIGGFTQFASTKNIQLRRIKAGGTETITKINYEAIVRGKSKDGLLVLENRDVILVPQRGLFEF